MTLTGDAKRAKHFKHEKEASRAPKTMHERHFRSRFKAVPKFLREKNQQVNPEAKHSDFMLERSNYQDIRGDEQTNAAHTLGAGFDETKLKKHLKPGGNMNRLKKIAAKTRPADAESNQGFEKYVDRANNRAMKKHWNNQRVHESTIRREVFKDVTKHYPDHNDKYYKWFKNSYDALEREANEE